MTHFAEENAGRDPKGYRFNDSVYLNFFGSAAIKCGRGGYEFLAANLPGVVPSFKTVTRSLYDCHSSVPEGTLNIAPLVSHLKNNKLPMFVSIAEDATAVISRREYCRKSNSITGFSLPLKSDGLPDSSLSVAKTAEDICFMFENYDRATSAMVVMAQPLGCNSPPFRICSFGTNNKFTAEDVENRMKTIEDALKTEGITVICHAADGDSRELKFMRKQLRLGLPSNSTGRGKLTE